MSEDLFAKAFRVSPAALWISDLLTGEAIDVNDSFLRMTGYSREEVIGQSTITLGLWVDASDRTRIVEELQKHGSVRDAEVGICKRSGEVGDGLISAEAVDIHGRQCLLINCTDITARKRAAVDLQSLSRRLLEVQENERRHIARELHDEIGQVLTAVQMNIEALKRSPAGLSIGKRLDDSIELIDQALQSVRDLSLDLRPSLLDDLGLVNALLWYVERQSERTGLDVQFTFDPPQTRLRSGIETACFRIAQEALTNVIRHAEASHVWIELRQQQVEIELTIRDDGHGFEVRAARDRASKGASLGLLSMQERAELAGGRLVITSEMGSGTTVCARLPLESPDNTYISPISPGYAARDAHHPEPGAVS